MEWKASVAGTANLPAWDSDNGNYRVVDCRSLRKTKPYRLMSFIHEAPDGQDVKFWDFATEQEAKEYAEYI